MTKNNRENYWNAYKLFVKKYFRFKDYAGNRISNIDKQANWEVAIILLKLITYSLRAPTSDRRWAHPGLRTFPPQWHPRLALDASRWSLKRPTRFGTFWLFNRTSLPCSNTRPDRGLCWPDCTLSLTQSLTEHNIQSTTGTGPLDNCTNKHMFFQRLSRTEKWPSR